jgi:hypothetical protein
MTYPYDADLMFLEMQERNRVRGYLERRDEAFDAMTKQLGQWMVDIRDFSRSVKEDYLERGYGPNSYTFPDEKELEIIKKEMISWAEDCVKAGRAVPQPEPSDRELTATQRKHALFRVVAGHVRTYHNGSLVPYVEHYIALYPAYPSYRNLSSEEQVSFLAELRAWAIKEQCWVDLYTYDGKN